MIELIELFVAFSNQILLNCPMSRCNSSYIYPHLLTTVHSHLLLKSFWDWIFSSLNFSIDKYATKKCIIFSLWVFPSSSYRNNSLSNSTQFCYISRHFDSVNVVELLPLCRWWDNSKVFMCIAPWGRYKPIQARKINWTIYLFY